MSRRWVLGVVLLGVARAGTACGSSVSATGTGGGSNASAGMNASGGGGGSAGGGGTSDDGAGDAGYGGTDNAGAATAGAGNGGDGGTSGAPDTETLNPCEGLAVTASGSPGLIDDFEDGDSSIQLNDGRHGTWHYGYVAADSCPGEDPLLVAAPVSGRSVNNSSHFAMRVQEDGCTVLVQVVGFNVGNGAYCPYDVTGYDGVYFWAVGAGVELTVRVGLSSTEPRAFGGDGTCEHDGTTISCWDAYQLRFTLTDEWALYSLKWSDLSQAGFGTATDFDPALVTELYFQGQSEGPMPSVDFSTDNVGFFRGKPPTTPPA